MADHDSVELTPEQRADVLETCRAAGGIAAIRRVQVLTGCGLAAAVHCCRADPELVAVDPQIVGGARRTPPSDPPPAPLLLPELPLIGQLFRNAYEGGLDVAIAVASARLGSDHGIPDYVTHTGAFQLALDAAHNHLRRPSFEPEQLVIDLSFRGLYPACKIPWDAIAILQVGPAGGVSTPRPGAPEPPPEPGKPRLRLI